MISYGSWLERASKRIVAGYEHYNGLCTPASRRSETESLVADVLRSMTPELIRHSIEVPRLAATLLAGSGRLSIAEDEVREAIRVANLLVEISVAGAREEKETVKP